MSAQKTIAEAKIKAGLTGAVEISILHKADPIPVTILLDNQDAESFFGNVWSSLNIVPGQHTVTVESSATPPIIIKRIVEVPAGGVARLEVKIS